MGNGSNRLSRKEAWPFYRTISGVRRCWELEKPKGPDGRVRSQSSLKVLTSREAGGPVHALSDRRTSGQDGHARRGRARILNTSQAPPPHSTVEELWSSEKEQSETGRADSPSPLAQSSMIPKTGKTRSCQRDCSLAQLISSSGGWQPLDGGRDTRCVGPKMQTERFY